MLIIFNDSTHKKILIMQLWVKYKFNVAFCIILQTTPHTKLQNKST